MFSRLRKKIAGILIYFVSVACCCGLLLWLVRAQHDHYKSKCERKSGERYLPFHCESDHFLNLPMFGNPSFGIPAFGTPDFGIPGFGEAQCGVSLPAESLLSESLTSESLRPLPKIA